MLAYERASWTDDQLNAAKPKEQFKLPDVEGGIAQWRWVEGSGWRVEGVDDATVERGQKPPMSAEKTNPSKGKAGAVSEVETTDAGWTYFDNKWQDPRPGVDGWSRYTRRRKWSRDAELVEIGDASATKTHTRNQSSASDALSGTATDSNTTVTFDMSTLSQDEGASANESMRGTPRKGGARWFTRNRSASKASSTYSVDSTTAGGTDVGSYSVAASTDLGDDGFVPMSHRGRQGTVPDWGVAEDLGMELG